MARNAQWKRTISDKTSWRQDQGLSATIYIVREIGPTGFLLKEDGESKTFKVFLGDPHSCTCPDFRKQHDLCKHLCWLLLKKFRVPREDPISWQLGLVEREINTLLHGEQNRRAERNRPETARKAPNLAPSSDGRPALEQREISEDDTCPICMEELLAKREPVTYCKYSCANSIHIKCMKIWAEHQQSSGEKTIKCPFCREDFGPLEYLREEYRNTVVPNLYNNRVVQHPGSLCRVCSQSPIQGKCYRCMSCNEYHLCQKCFNTPTHTEHSFEFRSAPMQRWRPAQRHLTNGVPLPSALVNNLMSRDIGDHDYDLLLQLDNPAASELSQIPESVIQKFPIERVRVGSRYLAPGEQCCVCLRSYQPGDHIRRLPCRHKFHRDCIDNWLLHQHPTCPVDGQVVWNQLTANADTEQPRRRRKSRQIPNNNRSSQQTVQVEPELTLEIPGIGISRVGSYSAPAATSQLASETNHRRASGNLHRGVINRERDASPESEASLNLNLAQLLNIDPQHGATQNLILTPDTTLQDLVNPGAHRNAVNRVLQSNLDAANQRRRQRNLTLAAQQKRNGSNLVTDQISGPSIMTTQPLGVSSLFLGNPASVPVIIPTINNASRVKSRVRRNHKTELNNNDEATQQPAQLCVGDGRINNKKDISLSSLKTQKTSKHLLSKKGRERSEQHHPNLDLELNGTKWQ